MRKEPARFQSSRLNPWKAPASSFAFLYRPFPNMKYFKLPFSSVIRSTVCAVLAVGVVCLPLAGGVYAAGEAEVSASGAEQATVVAAPMDGAAPVAVVHKEHKLPSAAPVIARFGFFEINSSMIMTWIVAILIIGFAQYATRNIKQVPDGAQNFWEWLIESLRNFLESIIGRHLTSKTFWFFASVFVFILSANWIGLIPGVGTVGWGQTDSAGEFYIEHPLLRGANADLNMTFAMALVFFACWIVWAIQENGAGGAIMHIFGVKGDTKGFMRIAMVGVFIVVGLLEVVTIFFRPVTLAFRLYGNTFAGENILESMAHIVPLLAPIIPIPFYFMELLVGLVQALVFMLLTAVFTLLICSHDDHDKKESHAGAHH